MHLCAIASIRSAITGRPQDFVVPSLSLGLFFLDRLSAVGNWQNIWAGDGVRRRELGLSGSVLQCLAREKQIVYSAPDQDYAGDRKAHSGLMDARTATAQCAQVGRRATTRPLPTCPQPQGDFPRGSAGLSQSISNFELSRKRLVYAESWIRVYALAPCGHCILVFPCGSCHACARSRYHRRHRH